MMCSPLAMTNDLRKATPADKRILLNKEIITVNQDVLGKPAEPKMRNNDYQVYLKQLSGGKYALAVLNISDKPMNITVPFAQIGLNGKYSLRDVWQHKDIAKNAKKWQGLVQSHQTKVFVMK